MRTRHFHFRRRSERGQALVETAIILPLLLFVVAGIVELGRAYQVSQVLNNAAREGARTAIMPFMDVAAAQTRTRDYMQSSGLSAYGTAAVTVDRNVTLNVSGTPESASQVDIAYPFDFYILQPIAQLVVPNTTTGGALTLRASVVMRNQMP